VATARARKAAAVAAVRPRKVARPANEDGHVEPSYFASGNGKAELKFVSSGCAVMDEALGGGYVLGRVANLVGDRSVGKTLNAMEVCANVARSYPDAAIRYAEAEAAFDRPYAGALGIPLDRIEFNRDDQPLETVEDLYEDILSFLDRNIGRPGLYVLDSLDALSDDAEVAGKFNEASYGGAKPKAIGQLFRRLVQRIADQDVLLLIVSQIRDVLNARPFQETKRRSGGKALDFYATHIVWLSEIKKIKRTINKIERTVGVDIKARVRKNKIGLPFREAEYPVLFGYGIDDMTASVEWLIANHMESRLAEFDMSKAGYPVLLRSLRDTGGFIATDMRRRLADVVRTEWASVETSFLPKSRKY
jgi:recombination protein RecA